MTTRQCGDCSACCYTHGVEEINKPKYTACAQQCISGGCLIYQQKPDSCTRFECAWHEGIIGNEEHRPDITGLVFWSMHPSNWRRGFKTLNVIEGEDDAHLTPQGQAFMKNVLSQGWVLILRSRTTKPMLQYHINRAVPGIEYLVEELVDASYMVQTINTPLLQTELVSA